MLADLFVIKETGDRGKGLFAKVFIPTGTIVFYECEKCQICPEYKFIKMSKGEQESYLFHAYRRKDGSYLMPCDQAKFLNHSCNSNILDTGKGFDIVVRDIQAEEEATYDYRGFYDDLHMACDCGEPNCCKIVTCQHPAPATLKRFWNKRLIHAFDKMNQVSQPIEIFDKR